MPVWNVAIKQWLTVLCYNTGPLMILVFSTYLKREKSWFYDYGDYPLEVINWMFRRQQVLTKTIETHLPSLTLM